MERLHTVPPKQLDSNIIPEHRLNDLRTFYEGSDDPVAERLERRESRRRRRKLLGERAARQDHAQSVIDKTRSSKTRRY